ncbi:hypothetical protein Tco_0189833 [Tanacetum coccineum]
MPVSPPLPVLPLLLPVSPTYPLGFRAAMIRQRAESPSTSHSLPLPPPIILSHTRASTPPSGTPPLLPIPLPTPSPPLLLPSTEDRADRPEVCLPPRKRLYIALGPRYKVGESSSAPLLDLLEDTDEIYVRLNDAQDDMSLMSGRLNMLFIDRRTHARTALLMEREARLSREAWGWSIDTSDTTRSEVRALRTTVLAHQTEIAALRAADHTRQSHLVEILRLMSTLQTQKMAPKRATRSKPATTTTTTSVTNAQLKALIDQGVADALATHDAVRSMNGDDNHNLGTGVRRQAPLAHLKKKMIDKYCPRGEIKKLEAELWNLKVKESDKIKRYVRGLLDMIHRSVVSSRPKTMQEAIEIATELMDKKIRTFAERQSENKRKQDDNQQQQQQQNKRQNTDWA